jgi:CBS domain-containing protein
MAAMVARRIRHIPVIDEEGGLVSMSDVVKYQLQRAERSSLFCTLLERVKRMISAWWWRATSS